MLIDGHENVLSIRISPTEEPIRFEIVYDIIPKRDEKIFFTGLLISLISLSILFLLLSTKLLDYNAINLNEIFPLKHIYYHVYPFDCGLY